MVSDDAKGDRHSLQSFHRIFISDVITSKQNTDPVRKRGENVLRLFFLVLIENNENNTEQWKTHKNKQLISRLHLYLSDQSTPKAVLNMCIEARPLFQFTL